MFYSVCLLWYDCMHSEEWNLLFRKTNRIVFSEIWILRLPKFATAAKNANTYLGLTISESKFVWWCLHVITAVSVAYLHAVSGKTDGRSGKEWTLLFALYATSCWQAPCPISDTLRTRDGRLWHLEVHLVKRWLSWYCFSYKSFLQTPFIFSSVFWSITRSSSSPCVMNNFDVK